MVSARAGWSARLGAAMALAIGDPALWLFGLLGFAARGGILLLALPIVTVPSPVLLSIAFRGEMTAVGPAPSAPWLAFVTALGLGVVVLVGLLVSSWADVAAFERAVRDPETDGLRVGVRPVRHSPREQRALVAWVAAIGATGLIPVLLGAIVAAMSVPSAVVSEVQSPSSTAEPLFERVADRMGPQLLAVLIIALVMEVCVSMATRRVLGARGGVGPGRADASEASLAVAGAARLVREPGRSLAVASLGWLCTLAAVVPVVATTVIAWDACRDMVVALGDAPAPGAIASGVLAVLALATAWVVGLVLVGFAASLRAALWTTNELA
jgi:hypothetical protein